MTDVLSDSVSHTLDVCATELDSDSETSHTDRCDDFRIGVTRNVPGFGRAALAGFTLVGFDGCGLDVHLAFLFRVCACFGARRLTDSRTRIRKGSRRAWFWAILASLAFS
jgi:hypothetical protein